VAGAASCEETWIFQTQRAKVSLVFYLNFRDLTREGDATVCTNRSSTGAFLKIRFFGVRTPPPGLPVAALAGLPGFPYGGVALLRAASQSKGGGAERDGEDGVESGGV